MPSSPLPPSSRILISKLAKQAQHSPVARAALLGWAAESVPALVRVALVAAVKRRRVSLIQVARELVVATTKGLRANGLAVAFAVAVGGIEWADQAEPLVRTAYEAMVGKARRGKGKARETDETLKAERIRAEQDERNIKALSTFVASSVSSLLALLILQSPRRRPRLARSTPPVPALDFNVTPYIPVESAQAPVQSPTLDLTLFIFVRAADTLVRLSHERAPPARGRFAPFLRFAAEHGDVLLFSAASSRVMWSWFYRSDELPPSYSKFILQLARMDPRLLQLLRYARAGRFVYGKEPDEEVSKMCAEIAAHAGQDASLVNPASISRLNCSFVHGRLGAGSCETNALKRWARALLDSLLIYLPVHAIPPLLFNLRRVLRSPSSSLLRILFAASRSSAFLATFVASIYASVCLVRTRLPQLFPFVPQQPLDSGLCVLAGCFACGWSVLLENPRRRREMALYVAPRAVYAILDEIIPSSFKHGKSGELLCAWLERVVVAVSSGTVLSAAVHRPDLISGVVRGVTSFAVGSRPLRKKL
ncbi:hypothetical protein JCM8547_001049 [Rhodosporidiobolus lusitaniae]